MYQKTSRATSENGKISQYLKTHEFGKNHNWQQVYCLITIIAKQSFENEPATCTLVYMGCISERKNQTATTLRLRNTAPQCKNSLHNCQRNQRHFNVQTHNIGFFG